MSGTDDGGPRLHELTPPHRLHVQLRDGTRLLLRPIVPEDRDRLASGMDALSQRSRRMRFFSPAEQLSEATLDRLTDLDPHQHVAWGALSTTRPREPGAGVARAIGEGDRGTVELAITIADDYQGRGLGVVLLAVVLMAARAEGHNRLTAEVLAENERMLDLLRQVGAAAVPPSGAALTLEGPLPDDLGTLPPGPMRGVLGQLRDHVAGGAEGVLRIADHGPPTPTTPPFAPGSTDLDQWLDTHLE